MKHLASVGWTGRPCLLRNFGPHVCTHAFRDRPTRGFCVCNFLGRCTAAGRTKVITKRWMWRFQTCNIQTYRFLWHTYSRSHVLQSIVIVDRNAQTKILSVNRYWVRNKLQWSNELWNGWISDCWFISITAIPVHFTQAFWRFRR